MATAGPSFPGTGADDATVGTVTWSTPTNITADDAAIASTAALNTGTITHYLKGTNFGFAIPGGATINGILVEWKRKCGQTGAQHIRDNSVKIVQGGVISGTDLKDTVTDWPTALTYASYGGSSNLWGLTWAASDINASTFGAVLSGIGTKSLKVGPAPNVDAVRITITYTAAASGIPNQVVQVRQAVNRASTY